MTAVAETEDVPLPNGLVVDLKGWMQRWVYTPGLQFVRLSRLSPAEWPVGSRQSIAGDLEDLLAPIDTGEILQRWGGGVYVVTAIQADNSNQRRVVERKRVELAGPPRAVPGHDGLPVAISNPPTTGPGAGQQPTATILDLNAALQRVASGAQESNTVAALQQSQREYRQELAATQSRYENQIAEMRKELRSNTADREQPIRDALAAQQRQFDKVVEAHSVQLDALRAQHETQLAQAMRSSEKNLEARELSHRQEIAALRDQQRNDMETVRSMARVEVESLRNELQRERSERDRDNRDLRSQLDAARADASAQAERRANEAREMARQLYEPQIAGLRAELADARKMTETVRSEARADMDRRERDVRAQLEAVNTAKEAAIQGTLESKLSTALADVRSRDERLARQDEELRELRVQVSQRGDPVAQIQAVMSLKDTVMGLNGAPQPQGILQSLAQVAGPLRENVIEPVLARVDRGLEVASAESARRADIQRAMLGNRATQRSQVARQLAGPARRRIVGGAQGGVQRTQGTATAAAAAPASSNPANRDGAVSILQQLEAWMNDGTTPAAAVAQIRAAAQAGMVPQNVLNGIINTGTADLVRDVQSSAEQLGLSSLASPRGEEFIGAVHRALRA